jgi:formate hydrogenlyase transcriptional activator
MDRRPRPTQPKSRTADLGIGSECVPLGSHVAYFWETDKEFADAVGFLEAGLRGTDHCVIFGHEEANQAVCKILQERGFNVEALQAERQLTVLGGNSSGDTILHTIASAFEQGIAGGVPLIRLLGNIGWGKHNWPDEEDLLAFEAKVTTAAKQFPCVVVCMYDVHESSGLIVRHGAFETHPLIVQGQSVRTNPYYVPADVFLERLEAIAAHISERRRTEETLRKSEERFGILFERSRTLLDINNALISNLTQEALFRAIAQALRRVVPFDRTAIFLHDPDKDVLRLFVLESSLPSSYFTVGLEMAPGESHVGWVFRHQRPLLRRDLERERQYPMEDHALADGVRSYVIVPLMARGKTIGALAVASTTTNQYSEADAAFLQEAANQVALAVENMKAYEEIATLKARLEHENVYLQEEIRREHNFVEMVGSSPALLAVLRKVEQVAPIDSTVLISGETGTGKELIARAIHNRSARKDRPLVKVNCSAISAGLVESELFGHVKGAFTGALERRIGRFELAHGGTIFLDEVGELAPETQVKLLRVLQEQEFEPVGSSRTVRVDVRVIAASNRGLEEAIRAGRFRADLFYRLNVFPIEVPPLRERRSDIRQLVMFFLSRFSKRFGKKVDTVSQATMERLTSYPWPGNVRELQNIIERAVVLAHGPVLELVRDLLPIPAAGLSPGAVEQSTRGVRSSVPIAGGLPTLEEMERSHILSVLKQTGGVIEGPKGAARILKVHPNTLRSRMVKLGIKRSSHEIA